MKIHNYIHEYNFPYHDYLLSQLSFIDDIYEQNILKALENSQANVMFFKDKIWDFLTPKLDKIITENYYVTPPFTESPIGIYKQTSEQTHIYSSHNHINTSSITGVFYINPPQHDKGGELVLHIDNVYDNVVHIQPQPNKLYLFPSWVYHHVTLQTSTTPRYSLNWGYMSGVRPIHKVTGDLW